LLAIPRTLEHTLRTYSRHLRLYAGLLACLCLPVTLATCSRLLLIAPYDEQIDQSATALQRRMDAFLTTLAEKGIGQEARYEANKEFYAQYGVDLRSLLIRAQSWPKNNLTENQLNLMLNNLEQLRTAHADAPLSAEAITTFRDLFNQGWRAILTLELAKKTEG
jgi:hypothetical protein